jgi:aspartyl aminopeptidase
LEDSKKLEENFFLQRKKVWDFIDDEEKEKALKIAEEYKKFLDEGKTEREAAQYIINYARNCGFNNIDEVKNGNKFYKLFCNKAVAMVILGEKPLTQNLKIIVSHIDSPRLDLKQNPLYEEEDLVYLKTHYYGGIKKYHWVTIPLALHGKIILKNGKELDLKIGEKEEDPVFTVTDLLPHLSRKAQYDKKIENAIIGEKLNVLIGSLPFPDKNAKDRVKLQTMKILNELYGIIEEDFISAELEMVPAFKSRDIGWDRSLIGGYGQDDRSCAFALYKATGNLNEGGNNIISIFLDKEEIGSEGNTGAQSKFIEALIINLLEIQNKEVKEGDITKALLNAKAISADVTGALNPDWAEVHEKRNAAKLGYGICISKFTGHRGKAGASDAHAEFMGYIRKLFNQNKIIWQACELGKVDEGGGGTVAKFLASYGMDIVDCGVSIMGMHSPYEISHKGDIYMTYKAYLAFLEQE